MLDSFPPSWPVKAAGSSADADVPFGATHEAGQTTRSRPRRRSVGGGSGERDTSVAQLVQVAGYAVLTLGQVA